MAIERGEKIKILLASSANRDDAVITGWIRQKRESKGILFLQVNDGSCLSGMQVIAEEGLDNFEELKKMPIGSSVRVMGSPDGVARRRSEI